MGKKDSKEEALRDEQIKRECVGEIRHALLFASLFRVSSDLTNISYTHRVPLSEVLASFREAYGSLDEWYHGDSIKSEVEKLVDMMLPEQHMDRWEL